MSYSAFLWKNCRKIVDSKNLVGGGGFFVPICNVGVECKGPGYIGVMCDAASWTVRMATQGLSPHHSVYLISECPYGNELFR